MDPRLILLLFAVAALGQFPVNDTGVPLPSGCKQVLWYRGSGTQDYICSDPTNMGMLMWTLVEPHAALQTYSGNLVATPINGYHFFSNPGMDGQAGSGPGWRLGSGCGFYSCPTTTDEFLGAVNTSAPQPGTIPWLLISKVSSYGPNFGSIQYVQRLNTVGGVVPISCSYLGQTYNVAYQADYLFATCTTSDPQPTQTTPPFNPNNPHSKYTKSFHTKNPITSTQTPTHTQTTPPFNPNNPHGKYNKQTHHPQTTFPPATPSPTDTPNVNTYESYTKFNTPMNVVPPTSEPVYFEQQEQQEQQEQNVPQQSHSQSFNYFQQSRQHNHPNNKEENHHHPPSSHSQKDFNYFKQFHSSSSSSSENVEKNVNSNRDPTPLPVEVNYNPHEQHAYRPRTRHYDQVEPVVDDGFPVNPRVDTPEVNQPPPTETVEPRGPRGRIGGLARKLNINPTLVPEEVNYNP